MISRRFLPFVLSAFLLPALPALASPEIGAPAPAFQAKDSNGKTVNLADLRGKLVVLEWSNHDCPFVVKHYRSANMQALQKEATKDGVVWLTVISSAPGTQGYVEPAEANALTAKRDAAPSNVLLDPTGVIGKAYGAQTTPHLYIVDPAGQLVYKGGIDSIPSASKGDIAKADNYVKLAFADLAAGRKLAHASTKPYGCSIKYAD